MICSNHFDNCWLTGSAHEWSLRFRHHGKRILIRWCSLSHGALVLLDHSRLQPTTRKAFRTVCVWWNMCCVSVRLGDFLPTKAHCAITFYHGVMRDSRTDDCLLFSESLCAGKDESHCCKYHFYPSLPCCFWMSGAPLAAVKTLRYLMAC